MEKLDRIAKALADNQGVVGIIRESEHEIMIDDCPCGSPEWEEYVSLITADALDYPPKAV